MDLVQGSGATPAIRPQPLGQTAKLGSSATFTTGATGIGPLQFQWTKNGTPVGSGPVYTLGKIEENDDQATIAVRVIGAQGATDSAPAILNVVRLLNGDFEMGSTGWSLWNPQVVLGPGSYEEVNPHGGSGWLCIGDWAEPCTDFAVQDITIPSGGSTSLSFWAGIANKSKAPSSAANIFKVKILDQAGAPLRELQTLTNLDAAKDASGKVIWKSYGPFSLNDWRGMTVRVRIESVQPGGSGTGTVFAVDDMAMQTQTTDTSSVVLTLNQGSATLLPGGSATFTVSGDQGFGVDWNLTGGSANGVFSGLNATVKVPDAAPLSTTVYTLKAALKADASKNVSAQITTKGMDLVADGSLNPLDLLGLAAEWGKPSTSPANFKGSGNVDDTDLTALLNQIK